MNSLEWKYFWQLNWTYAKNELFKIELIIYIQIDLALYNLQRLICHKTQTTDSLILVIYYSRIFLIDFRILYTNTDYSNGLDWFPKSLQCWQNSFITWNDK